MEEKLVLVSAEEYKELLNDSLKLEFLEGMGLDNWSGYGEVDWGGVEDGVEANSAYVHKLQGYNRLGEKL